MVIKEDGVEIKTSPLWRWGQLYDFYDLILELYDHGDFEPKCGIFRRQPLLSVGPGAGWLSLIFFIWSINDVYLYGR